MHRGPVRTIINLNLGRFFQIPRSLQSLQAYKTSLQVYRSTGLRNGGRYPRLYCLYRLYRLYRLYSALPTSQKGQGKISGKDYMSRANPSCSHLGASISLRASAAHKLAARSFAPRTSHLAAWCLHRNTALHNAPAPALARHSRITQPDSKRKRCGSLSRLLLALHKTVPRAPAFELRHFVEGKK